MGSTIKILQGQTFKGLALPAKKQATWNRLNAQFWAPKRKKPPNRTASTNYLRLRTNRMLIRSGSDLLSHVLRRSTISATVLNGRVRDGIGCFTCAMTTKPKKHSLHETLHGRKSNHTFVQSYYYWIKSSLSGN